MPALGPPPRTHHERRGLRGAQPAAPCPAEAALLLPAPTAAGQARWLRRPRGRGGPAGRSAARRCSAADPRPRPRCVGPGGSSDPGAALRPCPAARTQVRAPASGASRLSRACQVGVPPRPQESLGPGQTSRWEACRRTTPGHARGTERVHAEGGRGDPGQAGRRRTALLPRTVAAPSNRNQAAGGFRGAHAGSGEASGATAGGGPQPCALEAVPGQGPADVPRRTPSAARSGPHGRPIWDPGPPRSQGRIPSPGPLCSASAMAWESRTAHTPGPCTGRMTQVELLPPGLALATAPSGE